MNDFFLWRSVGCNVKVGGDGRFSLKILAVFSGVLLSSVQMSAYLKQVCLFLIIMFWRA